MTYDDWKATETAAELGEYGESPCPACGGDAAERDDDDGRVHVCRRCLGRGWLRPDDDDPSDQ